MSDATVAQALRSAARLVVVEAPGGCGKTYQGASYACDIAPALGDGRLLILTHTNAACDVFARRTHGLSRHVEIRTIDGLVIEIASAYCRPLGLPDDVRAWARRTPKGYDLLGERVARLLTRHPAIADCVAQRYSVSSERAIADLVGPIAAIKSEETPMTILDTFLNAHATELFDANQPVDEAFAAVWRAAASIAFDGMTMRREYRRSGALNSAGFCSNGWPVFEPNWPHAASFAPLIAEWIEACAVFEVAPPVVSALVSQVPAAFSPDPALGWLEQIMAAHMASDPRKGPRGAAGRHCGKLLATIWSATTASDRFAAIERFRRLASQLADFGIPEAVALLPEIAEMQA